MEESGMKTGYVSSRSSYLANIYEWANENDYAGTLVWQVYAWYAYPTCALVDNALCRALPNLPFSKSPLELPFPFIPVECCANVICSPCMPVCGTACPDYA